MGGGARIDEMNDASDELDVSFKSAFAVATSMSGAYISPCWLL